MTCSPSGKPEDFRARVADGSQHGCGFTRFDEFKPDPKANNDAIVFAFDGFAALQAILK